MSPTPPAARADAPGWIVLKFGGTSVSRRHRWDTIGKLMKRRADEEDAGVLVVVSALSGITNELQAVCDGHADAAGTNDRIAAIVHRHEAFADELGVDRGVLVERLGELIGAEIDTAELAEAEEAYATQVSEAVAGDSDTAAYVEELERRSDTVDELTEEGLPSGETLAAELTRFLRERDRDREQGDDGPRGQ